MRLPKKNGLFITGTDTGVGKTLVGGAIARVMAGQGVKVGVFKPIATGCRPERGKLISADARFLAKCSGIDFPLTKISPVTYLTPAAPIAAAEAEHRPVDYSKIEDAYKELCEQCDFVIVEGIGGIRVPISNKVDVLELACQFALPIVVVARAGLGTINHTLLTIDCIKSACLPIAGVVISGYHADTTDIAEKTAPRYIVELGIVKILATVPFDAESNTETGILGRAVIESVSGTEWQSLGRQE
jgi:dethiobiotin synthetase